MMWQTLIFSLFMASSVYADVRDLYQNQLPVSPYSSNQNVPILRQEQNLEPDGSYNWNYETGNGIIAQEQGIVNYQGRSEPSTAAQGSFAYTSPEGEPISLSYVADENGFQPQGSHLPTPPPIPAAIQRALEWIAAHPEPEQKYDPRSRF